MQDEKKYTHTIEVSRPTGPRVIPPLSDESLGYLAKYKNTIDRIKSSAAISIIRRPKVIAISSSLALAVIAHLAISSITNGFSNLTSQATILLTGAGAVQPAGGGSSYQGPGDVVSGAVAWGSCARVYTAAQASTATSLCDLKDATTGTVSICTLRGSSTGFVDLAGSYCAGSTTPSAACAAAAGGSCKVSKIYDQTANGNDFVQATPASMPALTFSAISGLPGITFAGGSAVLGTAASFTNSPPVSFSSVYKSTGSTGGLIMAASAAVGAGPNGTNQVACFGGSTLNAAATDNAFHALQCMNNGVTSGNAVVDGAVTSTTFAATAMANVLRIGRNNGGATMSGVIMESGFWPAILFTSGGGSQSDLLNTNQHSVANGYNF